MSLTTSPTRVAALLARKPRVMPGMLHEQEPADDDIRMKALDDAIGCLQDDHLDEADATLARVLHRHPRDADLLHVLGIVRHRQGREVEALALLRESLLLSPQHAGHWNNYGNVRLEQGQVAAAARAYRASIELAAAPPEAAHALHNLSTLQRKLGELDEAEACARRAIAAVPETGSYWYNLSLVLVRKGEVREGLLANSRAIALWPREIQARDQVIRALVLLGERAQAAELYREWLTEEPDNPVVQHQLAACLGEAPPARASDAYVEAVFDSFASSFDAKLEKLDYRAPHAVAQALAAALPAPAHAFDICDLGCGTGLVGPLIAPWAKRLAGCDLSVGMLRRARARGVYDVLHKAELVHYLRTQPRAFDVLVSADTLCYFGALDDVMHAAQAALRPRGVFVFTVEALPGDHAAPHLLQANGRYAHGHAHVIGRAEDAGFEVRALEPGALRMEAGRPVPGWLVSLQRG